MKLNEKETETMVIINKKENEIWDTNLSISKLWKWINNNARL